MAEPAVSILLVNYQNATDTIECLESLLRLDYPNFRVVVCDNSPSPESFQQLVAWATQPNLPTSSGPVRFDQPRRKFEWVKLSEAELGQNQANADLTLVKLVENKGFAAANNRGINFILGAHQPDYVWLLNNDTVVEPTALTHLVKMAETNPKLGMVGSLVCFYDSPQIIQVAGGGHYQPVWGLTKHLAEGRPIERLPNREKILAELDYIYGAALFVSAKFIREVGLMSEDYFLYHEELDWAWRGRDRFELGFSPESRVFHKHSRSIGGKSLRADYYDLRGRLILTKKFCPQYLPTVYLAMFFGSAVKRLLTGQFTRAWLVWRLLVRPNLPPPT